MPELEAVSEAGRLAEHRAELALGLATASLSLCDALREEAPGGAEAERRGAAGQEGGGAPGSGALGCAASKLHLLRAAALTLVACTGGTAGGVDVPRPSALPSPLVLPGERSGRAAPPSPPPSPRGVPLSGGGGGGGGGGGAKASTARPRCSVRSLPLLAQLAQRAGDTWMGLSEAGGDAASPASEPAHASALRDWLSDTLTAGGVAPLPSLAGALGSETAALSRAGNVQDACCCYYWALRLSDKVGADPPALVRRLGGALNQRGRLALVAGELRAAEAPFRGGACRAPAARPRRDASTTPVPQASFRDAFAAFSHASDPVNPALVLVNHATVCRSRARSKQRARSACRSATLQALVAAGASLPPEGGVGGGEGVSPGRRSLPSQAPPCSRRSRAPRRWSSSPRRRGSSGGRWTRSGRSEARSPPSTSRRCASSRTTSASS